MLRPTTCLLRWYIFFKINGYGKIYREEGNYNSHSTIGSELNDVIMMGSDFYETEDTKKKNEEIGKPNIGIGKNCKIASTIIDKNAAIGDNCQINISGKKYEDGDHGLFYSADGIIVIRKGTVIPAGTII